jgi:hypothetical protein
MPVVTLPPSAFAGLHQLFLISSLVSVWWDGERQLPFLQVEAPEGVSLTYSGSLLVNNDPVPVMVYRKNFTDGSVSPQGYRMHFTMPDVPDFLTFYYYMDSPGVSILIDRLVVGNSTTAECSFHIIGTTSGEKFVFCEYSIETI